MDDPAAVGGVADESVAVEDLPAIPYQPAALATTRIASGGRDEPMAGGRPLLQRLGLPRPDRRASALRYS